MTPVLSSLKTVIGKSGKLIITTFFILKFNLLKASTLLVTLQVQTDKGTNCLLFKNSNLSNICIVFLTNQKCGTKNM